MNEEKNIRTVSVGTISGDTAPVSPDDAAAILMQIGADDFDELNRLKQMLDLIGQNPDFSDACRAAMRSASEKIRTAVKTAEQGNKGISDSLLSELGILIEKAIRETEENGRENMPENNSFPEHTENADSASGAGSEQGSAENDYMPDDADMEMIGAFIAESNDLITNAEEALLALERNPEDMEAVSTVFRAFHNIKGTSAFFELSLMTEMAHHAESLLSRVRDREIRYAGGYPDLALRSVDMLKELFRNLEEAMTGSPFLKPKGYDTLFHVLQNPEAAGISDTSPAGRPREEAPEPAAITEREKEETAVQSPDEASAPEEAEAEEDTGDEDDHSDEAEAADLPASPEISPPARKSADSGKIPPKEISVSRSAPSGTFQPPPRRSRPQAVESSIRVPTDRLDRFIDMVGELVVSHSMVAQDQVVVGSGYHELQKKVAHTSKIVRELQNMSMSMRMIPLKTTFRKMARLVRDLSRKFGKNVTFVTEGEDTEIDRNMVDIINDPLVHMVRNALDHGIELPQERESAGKPRYGTVHLSACHSAGSVVVEITDDGRGLEREKILTKAKDLGLVEEDANLPDREVYNLIFEPGFSTAKIVSDVSGRGVGMDVVKRNIDNIRGHVEIQSRPGKGSTFKMSLPLTLAIIDGMVVRVGKEKYVIPTISIVRSVQPGRSDISTVLRRGEMLRLQGKLIPIFRLAELFHVEGAQTDMTRAIAVVVENDEQQAGLLVDELIGSQQIVIKTLGETLGNITGISGSAIMPDGKVGLILDVGGLVRLANTGK
ncbi:MAG: chemotaxis protein CheA [Desulfobacterales bacterium]